MSLSRYSIGGAFSGQPAIFTIDRTVDVLMAGVGEDDQAPKRWTVSDSLRDNYLPKFQSVGCTHAIVSTEGDAHPEPMRRLVEAAAYLSGHGITSWWYQPWVMGDAECALWRDHNPQAYREWRTERRMTKRPEGCNLALDIYQWKGNPVESWLTNRLELMKVYREDYPDARILPLAWHRVNEEWGLVSPEFFRAMLRLAVLQVGRVGWWLDPQRDTMFPWDPRGTHELSAYQRIFCEESGVAP